MTLRRRDFLMTAAAVVGQAACAQNSPETGAKITAIDCHAHVFVRGLKLANERRYTPDYDASISDYLAMLDGNGSSHGVLVQPSFLGTDNSYLLEALATAPHRLRGIAVVDPSLSAEELQALDRAGVVGLRLNLIGKPDPDFSLPVWRTHLQRVAALGWQVEIQAEARRLPHLLPPLWNSGVKTVVDHMGLADKALGVDDPAFRWLLEQGEQQAHAGRVFVKLSGAYRNGPGVAVKATPLLVDAFGPLGLVWGSDWPHTAFEKVASPIQARRDLDVWVPDPDVRKSILATSAARLFRFTV